VSLPPQYSVNHITAITAATFLADNKIVKRGNVPHDITATLPQTLPQKREKREEKRFFRSGKWAGNPEVRRQKESLERPGR
jgi:hypothetical protein